MYIRIKREDDFKREKELWERALRTFVRENDY